jgi:hypothetical protein
LRARTAECLLEAAFAEDGRDWGAPPEALARHPLARAGLDRAAAGVVRLDLRLGVPVVGLGAGAAAWYPPLGDRLGTGILLPERGGVANAIGAVVGRVSMAATGVVIADGPGRFVAHLPDGPRPFAEAEAAIAALEAALTAAARARAAAAGVDDPVLTPERDLREAEVEGRRLLVEATLRVTATGRPRLARA